MNTRTVTRTVFTSPARTYTAIEPLESRIAPAITLIGLPDWDEQGARPILNASSVVSPGNAVDGAVQSIAVNPNNPLEIYLATVNGGIWHSTNADPNNPGAITWAPLSDQLGSLATSSIEFSPLDATGKTLFAGTGTFSNLTNSGGSSIGILRTTDGGANWSTFAVNPGNEPRIKTVLPTSIDLDPGAGVQEMILVAGIGGNGGLFRSDDNGQTFSAIDGANGLPDAQVTQLIADPNNANRFYAAVPGSGVYRGDYSVGTSTITWTAVNTNIPAGAIATSVNIQIAAHDAGATTVLYSGLADTPVGIVAPLTGVFTSTDNGANWNPIGTPTGFNAWSLGGSGFNMIADPTNSQVVYIGGLGGGSNVFRYNPGGATWDLIVGAGASGGTRPHADSRDMAFIGSNVLLESDDGGIYVIKNPLNSAANEWKSFNGEQVTGNALGAMEFHNVAWDSNSNVIFGGAQDNGTSVQQSAGSLIWTSFLGGDGGDVVVDTITLDGANQSIRYASSQNLGGFSRFIYDAANNAVGGAVGLVPMGGLAGFIGQFITPVEINAIAAPAGQSTRIVVGGGTDSVTPVGAVYEANNAGLAANAAAVNWVQVPTGAGFGGVSALASGGMLGGVGNADVLYAGTGGAVFVRSTAGGTLTATPTDFPGASVTDITLDPTNWMHAFVSSSTGVWETADAGANWTAVTGNLSNINLQTIEFVENGTIDAVVVGGEGGVFRMLSSTPAVWTEFGLGMPNTVTFELDFNAQDNVLVAGTFGRGAWTVPNLSASISMAGVVQIDGDTDFAGQNDTIRLVRNAANPSLLEIYLNNNTSIPDRVLPLSTIDQINVNGLGGNDTLIVDSSNGLITVQDGIHYDGGSGHDAMRLEQPGNATPQTSDVYSVGPAIGGGSSVITGPSGVQDVEFENLEPVLDLVPAASQIVNATPENNAIDYAAGAVPANGRITIDNYESFEFSNKVALTINGLAGSDEISLNNPTTPTGLTNITVDGGNPTGSDTLIFTGRTGLTDNFRLAPTGAGAGAITNTGVPATAFAGIEHLDFVLQFGNDNFTVDGTAGNDDYRVFSGSNPGQVHIEGTMNQGAGSTFALPSIDVTGNGVTLAGNYNFNGVGGTDLFTVTGTASDDGFVLIRASATSAGVTHSVNGATTNFFSLTNLSELTIDGLDGDDDFSVPGNFPFTLNLSGGDPSGSDVLNFTGSGVGSVTANLTTETIQETGFSLVTLSGVEVANIDGSGKDFALLGAAGSDVLTLTPNATDYDLRDETPGLTLTSTNTALLDLNLAGGTDWLTLFGTAVADSFGFTGTSSTAGVLLLNMLPQITYSNTERAVLDGLDGDDLFLLGSALGRIAVVGGDGSDTVDFSVSPSSVHFDLDAVGIAQFVNLTGEIVTLLERMENFVGTAFNDILNVDAATFPRTVNGGPHLLPLPPGDKLILDGQGELVTVVKSDFNTGVIHTKGHEDVVFDEFETIKIINSSGGIFDSKSFSAGIVYDLTQEVPAPGKPIPGKAPTGVATGDLNGDGFADIVTANNRSGNMSVLINKGDGTFNPPVNIKTGANPQDIALGDFDGDLDLDVVITNSGASNVAVLLGNGAGGFGAPTLIKTKPKPGAIALGDLNGDLVNDLVVTHVGRNTISVLIGNGAGGFGAPVETKTGGTGPVDVVIADFDLDTDNDVAIVNTSSRTISLLTGNGAGGFAGAPQIFKVGVKPTGLAVTDVNIDGSPDLVVSHYVSRFVGVLLGNGAVAGPQFKLMNRANFPGTHGPNALAVADFNGDGFIDLGFANGLGGKFTAILGNGLGDFSSPYEFDMGDTSARKVSALSIVDVNNDGGLDIVTANTGTSDISVLLRNLV